MENKIKKIERTQKMEHIEMTVEEKIDAIEKAKQLIRGAMELVNTAVKSSSRIEANYKVWRYGFNQLLGDGASNPYDGSLDILKEAFEEEK